MARYDDQNLNNTRTCVSVCVCETAFFYRSPFVSNFAHMSSSLFVFGEMRDYVAEWRQRGDWVRFPCGDRRSWWPRWNMKALCERRGVRSFPHRFMMDTFPPSRSGCHDDDEWLPSASAAPGGMWQPGGPPTPQLPSSFTHLFFVFTSPLMVHRATESLSNSLRWPTWRFSHKSSAVVKPDGRHTTWALPVTNRKWPVMGWPDSF